MQMLWVRPALSAAAIAAASLLCACGGGGGGSATGGGGGVVPPPTAAPVGIALLPASAGSSIAASVVPSSPDEVVLAQSASTPTEPASGGTLSNETATIAASATLTAAARARSPQDAARFADLRARIVENRRESAADGLRERPMPASVLAARLRTVGAARGAAPQSLRRTSAAPGTVGTQRQFKILTSNIGNSGGCAGGTSSGEYECNVTITATLEAVGAHGNIWVDNASLGTAGEFTVAGEFQTIANDFDQYYATETTAFEPAFYPGTPPAAFPYSSKLGQCDANGNDVGKANYISTDISGTNGTSIDVVITDALTGTGEGGYYYVVNEYPQAVWNCAPAPKPVSNNTSMVVITGNQFQAAGAPLFNEPFWLNTDVPRALSHELQHLIHAHYKVLRPEFNGQSGTFDDAFLDEGCSMLAEDLAANGVQIDTPRYSYSFLLEPSLFSLTAFTGYQPNPTSTSASSPYGWYSNTAGSYGQAYLFQRYLYDRFGDGYLKAIYNSQTSSVTAVSTSAGEPFAQLYREFSVAVSAQNTPLASGPYAFSTGIVLRGNVDVPSVRTGAQSTRHLVFGGPQPPETFTNALPTGTFLLAPGASGSAMLIDGATLFLPGENGPNGTTVTVTAPGASALQGASVQGSLPTPPPSST